jgi:ParB/RepB/Spo0J family partition protein
MGNLDLFESKDIPNGACPAMAGEPLQVPIHCLDRDPANPRTEFPQQDIDDLARDIALRGILQPIVASATAEPGKYLSRFGNKRWRAAKRAGLREVPVTITAQARDAYDQVAEDMKRHALSPLDLARLIRKQIDGGESNAMVAKRLGIDQTTVAPFPAYRDLAGFDFAHSEINEALVRQLHRCEFLEQAHNGPGTGKTHLATALGIQAIEHHHRRVRFFSTVELVNALELEKARG